jgi:hypothetical protein
MADMHWEGLVGRTCTWSVGRWDVELSSSRRVEVTGGVQVVMQPYALDQDWLEMGHTSMFLPNLVKGGVRYVLGRV